MPVTKVTIEEYDENGMLTKRTTTEYDNEGRAAGDSEWPPTIPWWRGVTCGQVVSGEDYQSYNNVHVKNCWFNPPAPITSGIFTTEPGARLEITGGVKITAANTVIRNIDFKGPGDTITINSA